MYVKHVYKTEYISNSTILLLPTIYKILTILTRLVVEFGILYLLLYTHLNRINFYFQ